MGRTLPTQIQILHEAEETWKGFRRALRKEDQESFDVAWSYARRHAMAASMAARPLPFEAQALSMIIGLHREIQGLKKAVIPAKFAIGEREPARLPARQGSRKHVESLDPRPPAGEAGFRGDDEQIRGQNTTKGV